MRLVLTFLLSLYTFFGTTIGTDCPDFWTSFRGSCYSLYQIQEEWVKANFICEEHRARLAFIETAEENAFLTSYIKRYQVHPGNIWIGANDMMGEGNFTWGATGEKLTYSDWQAGEPNNQAGEDCVAMRQNRGFQWNDQRCSQKLNFICEHRPIEIIG